MQWNVIELAESQIKVYTRENQVFDALKYWGLSVLYINQCWKFLCITSCKLLLIDWKWCSTCNSLLSVHPTEWSAYVCMSTCFVCLFMDWPKVNFLVCLLRSVWCNKLNCFATLLYFLNGFMAVSHMQWQEFTSSIWLFESTVCKLVVLVSCSELTVADVEQISSKGVRCQSLKELTLFLYLFIQYISANKWCQCDTGDKLIFPHSSGIVNINSSVYCPCNSNVTFQMHMSWLCKVPVQCHENSVIHTLSLKKNVLGVISM